MCSCAQCRGSFHSLVMVQNASVVTVVPFRQQEPFSIQPRHENREKGPDSAPKYLQMRGQLGRINHSKPTWNQMDWVFAPTYLCHHVHSILGLATVALIGPQPSGSKLCMWYWWHGRLPLRHSGELSITHQQRGLKMLLAPSGAPVDMVFRNGYCLKIAQTSMTSENLDFELWMGEGLQRCNIK